VQAHLLQLQSVLLQGSFTATQQTLYYPSLLLLLMLLLLLLMLLQ
jgi:hypothetical protein